MKAQITTNQKSEWIQPDYALVHISEIMGLENAAFDEIMVGNCLDQLTVALRNTTMSSLIGKIKYGGKIILTGADLTAISRGVITGSIDIEAAQNLIYKNNQSISSLELMVHLFQSFGLIIKTKRLVNLQYTITAERPLSGEDHG